MNRLSKAKSSRAWTAEEIVQSVNGLGLTTSLHSSMANHRMMNARAIQSDYRLAERIRLTESAAVDPIQQIRTELSRGNLNLAEELLAQINPDVDPQMRSEIGLELSRLYSFRGNWSKAIEFATITLQNDELSSISRLAALQIRANAFFEIENGKRAESDLDLAKSLLVLYPQAPVAFYAEILQLKLDGSVQKPADALRLYENWVHKRFTKAPPNLDRLLTALRMQIEFHRMAGLPVAPHAWACAVIADRMGDRLYDTLALVDLLFCESRQANDWARARLERRRGEFARADSIVNQVLNGTIEQRTPRLILASTCLPHEREDRYLFESPKTVLWLSGDAKINLESGEVQNIQIQDRVRSIFMAFSEAPLLSKAQLFAKAWGITRFDSDRHDTIIRTALKRLRRQSGIQVASHAGDLSIPGVFVLK